MKFVGLWLKEHPRASEDHLIHCYDYTRGQLLTVCNRAIPVKLATKATVRHCVDCLIGERQKLEKTCRRQPRRHRRR